MSDQPLPHAAEAALPLATCSACLELRSALQESEKDCLHILAMESERQDELIKALGVDPRRDVWVGSTRQEKHNIILNMILELKPNTEITNAAQALPRPQPTKDGKGFSS